MNPRFKRNLGIIDAKPTDKAMAGAQPAPGESLGAARQTANGAGGTSGLAVVNKLPGFWDCYAWCYDGLLQTIPYQQLLDRVVGCVPADTCELLDAGCGTGNLLSAIARRNQAINLHGLDASNVMLQRARGKLAKAQLSSGDLNEPLPYSDNSFDVVTCINVLYAVASPKSTSAELLRVLKPGGTLIASGPLARPRMTEIIRGHAAHAGWLRTAPLLLRLAALLPFNFVILGRRRTGKYHFLETARVREIFGCDEVSLAYAQQNWFVSLLKSFACV